MPEDKNKKPIPVDENFFVNLRKESDPDFVPYVDKVVPFSKYLEKAFPKVVDPQVKNAELIAKKTALDNSMQQIKAKAEQKLASREELDLYNHYIEREQDFRTNQLLQYQNADDLRAPLLQDFNAVYNKFDAFKAQGGLNFNDSKKYLDPENKTYVTSVDPNTGNLIVNVQQSNFKYDYDLGKNAYMEQVNKGLDDLQDNYEKGNYQAIYDLANFIQGPSAKTSDIYKSKDFALSKAFYNKASLEPAQDLANKIRSIANQVYFKANNPNTPLKEIALSPEKYVNSFGKDMLAQQPGTALYGKGQREEFENADPENANAQRINFSADLLGLTAIRDLVERNKTEKLAALARGVAFNKQNPLNKIDLKPILDEYEEAESLEKDIGELKTRDYLEKNYPEAYKELLLKEEKQKLWDTGAGKEIGKITEAAFEFATGPTGIFNAINTLAFEDSNLPDISGGQGLAASRLALSIEGGLQQLYNDWVVPTKSAISAGSISSPEFVMNNTLDKYDDIGYNIGVDEKGNPVKSGKFRWVDQNGDTHYNGWAAIETGIPIAVQMAVTMAATRGLGAALPLTRVFGAAAAPHIATFGSVFLTSYPKMYLEEYNNFKDSSQAMSLGVLRAAVEGLTESIIPNTPELLTTGTRSLFKGVAKTGAYEREVAGALDNTMKGLFPGVTNKTLRKIVDSRLVRRSIGIGQDIFQEAIIEEEASLLGNYFVDQLAKGMNPEYVTQNDLTADNIIDTAIESIAGMALTAPFMGGGTRRADNYDKALYRWKVANNPDHYVSFLTNKLDAGKITQEEYFKKVGQIRAFAAELQTLPINLESVRDMKTLLEDKDTQLSYFSNILEKRKLLSYVPKPEEEEEYKKTLADIDRELYKTEQAAGIYENLTTDQKNKIVADNFEKKRNEILSYGDISPATLDRLILDYKEDQKKNPTTFTLPLAAHIKQLEEARQTVKDNFINFTVSNNENLTFEQLDYKLGLVALNKNNYSRDEVKGMQAVLALAFFKTVGPVMSIKDEGQFIEALAKNYVTADKNKKPLVSEGKSLLMTIRENYVSDNLFRNFVEGLTDEQKAEKLTDLKNRFWARVVELKKTTSPQDVFPKTEEVVETAEVDGVKDIEDAFEAYKKELSSIKGDPETKASLTSEAKVRFIGGILNKIGETFTGEEDLYNKMSTLFDKLFPEEKDNLLEDFKSALAGQPVSRKLSRVLGKGVPKDFYTAVQSRLAELKKGTPAVAAEEVTPVTPVTPIVPGATVTTTETEEEKPQPTKLGKQQLNTKDKLVNDPENVYLITLVDGTKIEGRDFSMLGTDYIEGLDLNDKLVQIPINTLKSAKKLKSSPIPRDPNIENPVVITNEEYILEEFEAKDARDQFPQSGFITSSDEFDENNQEIEDDYSQQVNLILKNIESFPQARVSSMETYLKELMGPDIIVKISTILDSDISQEEKLNQLNQIFTEFDKPIFYTKTLAWWAQKGLAQFNEDLKAPAFYVTDSQGKVLRYTPEGPNLKGIPIHRNLPKIGTRVGKSGIGKDYIAIKVDYKDPIVQGAIAYMESMRAEIKSDPNKVYVVEELVVSPGAIRDKERFKFVPVGNQDLLVIGTDIKSEDTGFKDGYVVSDYEGEITRVSFPQLTAEEVEVLQFIIETPSELLPKEFSSPEKKLGYLNNFIFTNPYGVNNRLSFEVVGNEIIAKFNQKEISGKELTDKLKASYLNFNHTSYNQYTPVTMYSLNPEKTQLVEVSRQNYKDFINSKVNFFIPSKNRFNKKFYFGQPVPLDEYLEQKRAAQEQFDEEFEPFVFPEAPGITTVTLEESVVSGVEEVDEFVPMDITPVSEVVETLEKEEEAAEALVTTDAKADIEKYKGKSKFSPKIERTTLYLSSSLSVDNSREELKNTIFDLLDILSKNKDVIFLEGGIRRIIESSRTWYPFSVLQDYLAGRYKTSIDKVISEFKSSGFTENELQVIKNSLENKTSPYAELAALEAKPETKEGATLKEQEFNFPEEEETSDDFNEDDFNTLFRSRNLPARKSEELAKKALEWFESSEIAKLVDVKRLFNVVNSKAYAAFTKGLITLYQGSSDIDLYHESWHVFSQYFLTIKEKIDLYKTVQKKIGDVSYKEAEEYLAEGYQDYSLKRSQAKPKNAIDKIYDKIYKFIQRIFNHPQFEINKMFEALYTGNISQYAPSENNFMFKELFSGRATSLELSTPSGTLVIFSDRDLNELMSNLDATLIHQVLDKFSEKFNRRVSLGTVLSNKSNKKFIDSIYASLKETLQSNLNSLKKEGKAERAPMIARYEAILNSWPKVVKTHAKLSPVFTNKKVNNYEEQLDESQNSSEAGKDFAFNKSIEEFSTISRTKPEVIALVASIGKYKKSKLEKTSLLGLPVLDNFTKNWKILSKELGNVTDYAHMIYKIEKLVPDNPQFRFLLEALPKYDQVTLSKGELTLKTAFINTFSEPLIDMMKVRLNADPGNNKVNANVVTAESRASVVILKDWSMTFRTEGTALTKKEKGQSTEVIDLEAVKERLIKIGKVTNIEQKLEEALEFAQDMGLFLDESVLTHLNGLKDKNTFITSVTDFARGILRHASENVVDGVPQIINDPINQTKYRSSDSLKFLVNLALLAEEEYFSDEASNPEGNYIFKKNQFHFLTKVASWINEPMLKLKPEYQGKDISGLPITTTHEEYYPTFGELLTLKPQLSYLNPTIDAFSYGSNWMAQLYDVNGNRILNKNGVPESLLKIVHFGGTEYEKEGRLQGKKTTNLVAVDKLLTDINSFLSKGIQENVRFSDKGSAYAVYLEKTLDQVYKVSDTTVGYKTESSALMPFTGDSWMNNMDGFLDHAVSEVLAINQAKKLNKQKDKYKNYNKNGEKLRFLTDMLNATTVSILEGKELHDDLNKLKTLAEKVDYINDILDKNEVSLQIANYLKNEAKALESYIVDELSLSEVERKVYLRGLLPSSGTFEKFTTEQLLLGYTYYDTLHRIEQFKFFYRDPAFYKNADDVFKRLSKYSATGKYMITSPDILNTINSDQTYSRKLQKISTGEAKPYTDKVRVAIIKDELVDSANKDEYVDLVSDELGLSKEEAKKLLEGYGTEGKGAERADGQGIANLDFYRFAKLTIGEWLPEHEAAYQKEVEIYQLYKDYQASVTNGRDAQNIARQITQLIENQTFVFEPQKPQYAGPIADKFPATHFEKFSIYAATPSLSLVPRVNSKGEIIIEETDMFKILENMYSSNIDYLLMSSGSKDSALMDGSDFQSLYDEKGNVNQQTLKANEIYADFFKEQVQIDPHLGIHEIIFPTQLRGLLFLDEAEQGRFKKTDYEQFNRYKKVLRELLSVEKEKLKKQLGAKKDNFSDVSEKALAKFLERELQTKEVSSDIFNFFITKSNEFVFNYNGSTERRAISSILDTIVFNRIIKQKLSGTNYIQGANLGNTPFTKASELAKKTYGTNDMRFYSKDYQYCDVKIAFSARYKPLLNIVWKGERIGTLAKLNSLLRDEEFFKEHGKKVVLVGARIPTQGINSMERMRVIQFLPPSAGTLMLLPEEIVVKTGSDFDIDKLFVFEPTIDEEGNYYEYIEAGNEIILRNKLESLTETYDKKKRKLTYQLKALKEKITDPTLKEAIEEKIKQIAKEIVKIEKGLTSVEASLPEGEEITTSEKQTFTKEIEELTAGLNADLSKSLASIDKVFSSMTEIASEINDIVSTIKKIKYGRSNEFVNIISRRLGNPRILVNLILPNSNPDLQATKDGKSLPNFFNNKTKYVKEVTGSFTSLVKSITSNQVFKAFMVGKQTLGVAARMNKTHQITAQMNLFDTTSTPYALKTNNGNSLSKLKDTKGRYISSLFSQYINGLVDIAKGAWIALLGVDKIKGPIQMYIVKRGTNLEEAVAFTLQPIINKYAKLIAKNKSVFIEALNLNVEKGSIAESILLQNEKFLKDNYLLAQDNQGYIKVQETLKNIFTLINSNPNQTPINVYSDVKNGYERLSNFAQAPFKAEVEGKVYEFQSPEHYYQAQKAIYHGLPEAFKKIVEVKGPSAEYDKYFIGKMALEMSRRLIPNTSEEWYRIKKEVLAEGMRLSIENNPWKKELLLKTKEARILHISSKGIPNAWSIAFSDILMKIRSSIQPMQYSYFTEELLIDQLTNPTTINQLIYLTQYLYLENKSSNYVSFDQSYSPDTTKESGIIEHEITKQTKTKSLPLNFSGLDTFENTIISPFESLTDFSADLQKQTNDLLKNPTVLDKLVEIVGALKIDLPVDQLDYKKINGKLIDSLLLHIIHNHYKTDSGANFFEQNNLGFNNLSPLSLDSPKDVSFAKRYKMLSKLAKQEGVNLVKEFPVLKFFKSFFRPGSDYYTFIFSAGSNLTTLQKDEFKADLVDLLNYNHSNIEFATEVRNLFSEMLETLYVTTGFQFFEGNIAPIIPSSVYRTKVTKAIEEFLNQPYAKLKESLKHFTGNFLLYNYGEIALGEYTTESQKSFNIYNIKFADYGIKDPAIELSKGEQFFMDSLNSLPNNGLYLQLIEKICN